MNLIHCNCKYCNFIRIGPPVLCVVESDSSSKLMWWFRQWAKWTNYKLFNRLIRILYWSEYYMLANCAIYRAKRWWARISFGRAIPVIRIKSNEWSFFWSRISTGHSKICCTFNMRFVFLLVDDLVDFKESNVKLYFHKY